MSSGTQSLLADAPRSIYVAPTATLNQTLPDSSGSPVYLNGTESLLQAQADLNFSVNTKNSNSFTVNYGGGSGISDYLITSTTPDVCSVGAYNAAAAGIATISLLETGTCTLVLDKETDARFDPANQLSISSSVFNITQVAQTASDEGFGGTAPQNTPTGTNPGVVLAISGTSMTLANNSKWARTGYAYTQLCTEKVTGGTCLGAGTPHSITESLTLYPRWVANTITINYNVNNLPSGVAPAGNVCTYGTTYTPQSITTPQYSYLLQGVASSGSAWQSYIGNASQSVDASLSSATTTCFGTTSGSKTLYAVWRDTTNPSQVATPTISIPNVNAQLVRLNITRTSDLVAPKDSLEYRVQIGSNACSATPVSNTLMDWTAKDADFYVKYSAFALDVEFSMTICARDIAGNYTTQRSNVYKVHAVTYSTNDATIGIAPGTQYVLDGQSVTTSAFSGARDNYTFSGWATVATVNNTQTSCPGTHYSAGSNITNVISSVALYACWLDKSAPVLTSLTAVKTSETNVRFTINALDVLAGTATTWKLGTTAGADDLCAEQTLARTTCNTTGLVQGNDVVYYTIADLAGNVTSGSQEFQSSTGDVSITLTSAFHDPAPVTTDDDVSVTATVTTSASIAKNPSGEVTFTFTDPSAVDKTSVLLPIMATCQLVGEPDPVTNGYKSTCSLALSAALMVTGQWTISAVYNANSGTPVTGWEQLISSGSGSITPIIAAQRTYVEFTAPTEIQIISTNVAITGRVCEFNDALGGYEDQTCADSPQGNTIHYRIEEFSGTGYVTYTSAPISIETDGTFAFTLPQIPLKGHYHLIVYYDGSIAHDTSYSQTEHTIEVKSSGLTDGECSIPGHDNITDCQTAGGNWLSGEFAYTVNNTTATTARLDKNVTVIMKSPAKAISLVGDTATNGMITLKMYKRGGEISIEVPNSTVTHKLSNADCTNACDDSVQNEYSYTFAQPRYIPEPGSYFYTVSYKGNQAIGDDEEIVLGFDSSKVFDVQKSVTALNIDSIADFAYSNEVPAPAGVLATAHLAMPDYTTYPPLSNPTKVPTDVTNGALSYFISPGYDETEIRYTGVISNADTNCNPTAEEITLGWRGCTYLDDPSDPNTRKYQIFLGDYDSETAFKIDAQFGMNANADVSFSTSNATRTFNTFIPGLCIIGGVAEPSITNPADCQTSGGSWQGEDVKITYNIGAHGSFTQLKYQNQPNDYFQNPTVLASVEYITSGGYIDGSEVVWNPPNVNVDSGTTYNFAGWYQVPNPGPNDLPFSSTPELLTQNITLYAVYNGPLTGYCSRPQYQTAEECASGGGSWSEPGPYLTADRTSVYAGESLNISGYNFAPNEIVDVYLNSDPVLLTIAINNELGEFTDATITIPADTAPGRHTISALANPAWAGRPLSVPVDIGVQVVVRNDSSFECSDPQYTDRDECREHGGVGTWNPCDDPNWTLVTGCEDNPPAPHSPYPLPDNFPATPWVCTTDAVTGKTVCTNPEDSSVPQWQCDLDGTCWYYPDDFPANPGWVCDADGICTQRPPTSPEVVCDLVNNICWDAPEPPATKPDVNFPIDDNQPHDAVLPPNPPWACTMKPPPNESEPASCRYPITGGDYDNPGDDTDGDGVGDSGYWECDLDEASSGYLKCTWEPENANPTPDNPNWTCNIDSSSGAFLDCEPYPNPDGWVCNVYGNCHPSWGYKPFADAVITLSKTTALHDEEFSVTGHGFAPNQPLEILMHSEPQTLGIALSDDTGSFTLPTNVPAAELLDVGTHTVTAEDLRDAPAVVRNVPLERGPQLQVVGDCASKSWYAKTQSCIPPKLQVAPTGLNVTWGIIFLTLLTLGALGALRARRVK